MTNIAEIAASACLVATIASADMQNVETISLEPPEEAIGNIEAESQPTIATATGISDGSSTTDFQTVIPKNTPIHLMVLNEVSTKDHKPGHLFKLRVNKAVELEGEIVIPVGTRAWGELLTAESSGNVGKAGKLSAKLLYVEMGENQIPISGEVVDKGNKAGAATVAGVIALGPFGLFAKGNNAKIKAGEKMVAFVDADTGIMSIDADQ